MKLGLWCHARLFLFLVCFIPAAFAAENEVKEPAAKPERRFVELAHFRYFGLYAYQQNSSDTKKGWFLSTGLSWNPEFRFFSFLALTPDLGASILKSKGFGEFFLALDYRLMLSVRPLKRVFIEAGAGAQTWTNHGTYAAFALQAGYLFGENSLLQFLDRVWLGYTQVDLNKTSSARIIKLGLGFEF